MKTEIKASNIGFADSEIVGYVRDGSTVEIKITAWNGRPLQVVLKDTVGVEDHGLGDICALFKEDGSTPLMKRTLSGVYERQSETHPYLSFQFLNLDDEPRLEVIAQSIEIRV